MARKELIAALEALEPALRDLESAVQEASGGGLGGGGGLAPFGAGGAQEWPVPVAAGDEEGGGAATAEAGGVMALGRKHPIVAGIAAVSALAAPAVGAGIVSAAQGGTFSGGALSEINRMIAKVPVLGEASGIASAVRAEEAVLGGIGEQIAEIESRGGRLSDEMREFLLGEQLGIENRREDSREANRITLENMPGSANPDKLTWDQIRAGAWQAYSFSGLGARAMTSLLESTGLDNFK